jgi:hypothetical protein
VNQRGTYSFCKRLALCCIALLQLLCCTNTYAQSSDKKYFLGQYWSTKPDTTVQRKFSIYLNEGYFIKYENFGSLSQYPWLLNGTHVNISGLSTEPSLGNPAKLFVILPISFGTSGKTGTYSDASYTYNCTTSAGMLSAGFMLGRQLFPAAHNAWLKVIIPSLGFVYEDISITSSVTNQSLPNMTTVNRYGTGSILMKAELTYEIPGFYITDKTYKYYMSNLGFVLKAGYDFSPFKNIGALPVNNIPIAVKQGGFFFSVGIYLNQYTNKELYKEEIRKQ